MSAQPLSRTNLHAANSARECMDQMDHALNRTLHRIIGAVMGIFFAGPLGAASLMDANVDTKKIAMIQERIHFLKTNKDSPEAEIQEYQNGLEYTQRAREIKTMTGLLGCAITIVAIYAVSANSSNAAKLVNMLGFACLASFGVSIHHSLTGREQNHSDV